jgi:toxin CcdB
MSQFDVFENPITAARRAYPLVAVLQSELANTGRDRIVAPLALRTRLRGTAGRLTPHVDLAGTHYVLVVPSLTTIAAADLRERKGHLGSFRDDIVAALDYLFLGV